jgi:CheY-like chemotaxis protein
MAINEEGITMAPSVNLLLVEDDEVDVQGLRRAFNRSRIGNPITVARDGIEALEILRGQNGHQKLPKPHLVLLDLNMPRMNGIEFLEAIRNDEELKSTVVFMITTSKAEEDKQRAYGHNVAGYIVKQDPANTFVEAVSLLEHYWKIVEFPG